MKYLKANWPWYVAAAVIVGLGLWYGRAHAQATSPAYDAAAMGQYRDYTLRAAEPLTFPKIVDFNEGCYKVFLMPSNTGQCRADENNAYTAGTGIKGDVRMLYEGCYSEVDGQLRVRWTDGKPKHMRAATLVRPFPVADSGGPFPKSCRFPQEHYPIPVIVVQ